MKIIINKTANANSGQQQMHFLWHWLVN